MFLVSITIHLLIVVTLFLKNLAVVIQPVILLIFLNLVSFLSLQMYLTTINMYSNHLNGLRSLLIYVINVKHWK